jgi:hypothetical protein
MSAFNPQPKQGMPAKKAKKPLKRTSIKKKSKPTGEKTVFEDIAAEREWICYVTGEPLKELTPTNFIHVLPKALNRYPHFKLYPKNIVLGSDEVHRKWDFSPRSDVRKDPRFDKMFNLESELKQEYKELYGK